MPVRTQPFPPGVLALLLFVVLTGVALYGVWARFDAQGLGAAAADDLQAIIETAGLRVQEASNRNDTQNLIAETRIILDAADGLLAAEPNAAQRAFAIRSQLTALSILIQAGEPGSVDALRDLTGAHLDDADPDIATLAAATWLGLEVNLVGSQRAITEEMAATLAEAVDVYAAQKGRLDYDLLQYGVNLIAVSDRPELAVDGYRRLAELSKNFPGEEEVVAGFQERYARAADLMDSVGKPIEVTGTALDGSTIEGAAYRDRVLLVSFFSVANEQFVAGLPDLQRLYEAFRDKGFEIVGVSLDADRDEVQQFIRAQGIGWPVLFSDETEDKKLNHPLAVKYGILLPDARILLDREGKVVGFNAYGKTLEHYLEHEYGPIEPPAESEEAATESDPTEGEPAGGEPTEGNADAAPAAEGPTPEANPPAEAEPESNGPAAETAEEQADAAAGT